MLQRSAQTRTIGWMGLHRGHRAHPLEWLAEKGIFMVSLMAILMIFLIFVFIGREAMPVIIGRANPGATQAALPVSQMDKLSAKQLQEYLGLTAEQYAAMDRETLKTLMGLKVEAGGAQGRNGALDTTQWRFLLRPYQWTGYNRPEFIWQPVSEVPKYNLVPLLIGGLKVSVVALFFAVPLALGAAIFVSQLARPRLREWIKPAIELLAGIPSVVLGFFGLIVLASVLQQVLGYCAHEPWLRWLVPAHPSRLNALVAGVALGLAVIPLVFSIAEDALTSVPRSYSQAALALGASPWKAATQVVLPAALPGVFAAVALGFGRAIGETMVVLMASGNASIVSWNVLDSARTITATIAAELGEVVSGSAHYRILFLICVVLFALTFLTNLGADAVMHRLKGRLEGRAT